MPYCNGCGKHIEDWQVMCNICWEIVTKYDKKFFTNYAPMSVHYFHKFGRRDYITKSIINALRERMIPDGVRKMEKIRQKQKEVCINCERRSGKKDIDLCFKCPYHILFNYMISEINGNGR